MLRADVVVMVLLPNGNDWNVCPYRRVCACVFRMRTWSFMDLKVSITVSSPKIGSLDGSVGGEAHPCFSEAFLKDRVR